MKLFSHENILGNFVDNNVHRPLSHVKLTVYLEKEIKEEVYFFGGGALYSLACIRRFKAVH